MYSKIKSRVKIPLIERMIEFTIDRNDEDIELMYEKVKKARAFLNELEIKINNGNRFSVKKNEINND